MGLSVTHISSGFVGLLFGEIKHFYNEASTPVCACRFILKSNEILIAMEKLLIACFVEYQHVKKKSGV
jgi:hypothetical protein